MDCKEQRSLLQESKQILAAARRKIAQNYPLFLDATYHFEFIPDKALPSVVSTNGMQLFYSPIGLPDFYGTYGLDSVVYAILHLSSHCILGHLLLRPPEKQAQIFDALADFKAEKLLISLYPKIKSAIPISPIPSQFPVAHQPLPIALEQIKKKSDYSKHYLKYAPLMEWDDHSLWKRTRSEADIPLEEGMPPDSSHQAEGDSATATMLTAIWGEIGSQMSLKDSEFSMALGEEKGDMAGTMGWTTKKVVATDLDYRSILEEFLQKTVVEEESILTIDPMWYHFGLDYLGDVPLIEAGEEDMNPTSGTLVFAIDTSGSCQGSLCDQFLSELTEIMTSLDTMQYVDQIMLLQCDYVIQEERIIKSPTEWTTMVEDFQLKGGGGTSFEPVFQRACEVDKVVGLIYLTDGEGEFPNLETPFPSLLLLANPNPAYLNIPSWVETAFLPMENAFSNSFLPY